jgi:hypothetical protein
MVYGDGGSSSSASGQAAHTLAQIPALTHGPRGVSLALLRPLANETRVLDFATLGHLVREIVTGGDGGLSPADVATVASSVLNSYEITKFRSDPRVGLYFRALEDVRLGLDLKIVGDPSLREDLRDLYVALRLVMAHRQATSEDENAPEREIFAGLGYAIIYQTMYYKTLMKDRYPGYDEWLKIFETLRTAAGPDSSAAWAPLVHRLRVHIGEDIDSELRRNLNTWELRGMGLGPLGLFLGYVLLGPTVAGHLQLDHNQGSFVLIGCLYGLCGAGALGLGIPVALRPRRLAAAHARLDRFVDACDKLLTGAPAASSGASDTLPGPPSEASSQIIRI